MQPEPHGLSLEPETPGSHGANGHGNGSLPVAALHALSLGELAKADLPERKRILPWLPEGGLVMVYGPRGLGKTFFGIGLTASLITGKPFVRWTPTRPVGVMFIDGEMPLHDLRQRIIKHATAAPLAALRVVSHEWVFMRAERDINLGEAEWQAQVMAELDAHPEIKVIIVDNLSCLLPGIPEDKRDEWAQNVLPFLIRLRRRGVACVLVHHSGKGGDQRGTSSREDQLDTVIRLSRLCDADPTRGAQFLVSFTKSRGAYGEDVREIEVTLDDHDTGPEWTWRNVEQSMEDRLLNLVRDGIEAVSEAAEELGVSKGYVSKLKKRLIDAGKLKASQKLALAETV